MDRFLINTTEGGTYFDLGIKWCTLIGGRHLFKPQRLSEKILFALHVRDLPFKPTCGHWNLWSITTLEHDAVTHFGTSSRKLHKNRFQSFLSLSNFSSFFIFPNIFCRRLQILFHCTLQAAPPLDPTLTNTVGLGLHIPWKRLPFMVFSGYFTKYFRKGVFHTTPSGFYLFKATMVTPGQCVKSVQS